MDDDLLAVACVLKAKGISGDCPRGVSGLQARAAVEALVLLADRSQALHAAAEELAKLAAPSNETKKGR